MRPNYSRPTLQGVEKNKKAIQRTEHARTTELRDQHSKNMR